MTYIPAALRRAVIERADNCCEYCRRSQDDTLFTFHIEHIISEKHQGETTLDNLALSCPACNTFKGSDIASIDVDSGQVVLLYNPRQQTWSTHFRLNEDTIEGLTPEGRITTFLLQFNSDEQRAERRLLIALKRYPCGDVDA